MAKHSFKPGNQYGKVKTGSKQTVTQIKEYFLANAETISGVYIKAAVVADELIGKMEKGKKLSNYELKALDIMIKTVNKALDKVVPNLQDNKNENLNYTFEDYLLERKKRKLETMKEAEFREVKG